ncbi:hypothetical protein ACFQU7_27935 [Pseudoroseomonas wenyumeiae]
MLQDPVVITGEGGLVLGPGARLSFDTYFNSFYERPWSRHIPLGGITLRLFGTGQVHLQWYRSRHGEAVVAGEASVVLGLVEGALVPIPVRTARRGRAALLCSRLPLGSCGSARRALRDKYVRAPQGIPRDRALHLQP